MNRLLLGLLVWLTALSGSAQTVSYSPGSVSGAAAITSGAIDGAIFGGTTANTVTQSTFTVYTPSANSAFTVSLANGLIQKLTTNNNVTVTLPASVAGKAYRIIIAYGGTHTLTFAGGSTIKWAGGATPVGTATNAKFDVFDFWCDGTNTYGTIYGQNF